ncbi:hypothetical protein TorRG33x02_118480 [Trema orientale]|uniref:Endonuclease/exonuclease/phosphatase n=1 Tax=Trema orientale TaxID=63057 RepID=A0A2P5F3G9_TREOI|nr:hypothetical protein TorRG33x02_118480 [Trema orientale]
MIRFWAVLEDCGLCDLGFLGLCLTWNNGREAIANLKKRLARVVANGNWIDLFPIYRVTNLEFWSSNHRVVLLELMGTETYGKNEGKGRGFRFETWWINDAECIDIVSGAWANNSFDGSINSFLMGLDGCTRDLKK